MTESANDKVPLPGEDEQPKLAKSSRTREDPHSRAIRLEREASELQASLRDGVIADVKTKVAWVLNLFPHTRNSDISLALKYWELFQPDIFHPTSMKPQDLFRLERQTNIVRVRAKIQNEYQLFPADAAVRRRRRALEDDIKDAVIEDKPARNVVYVYADETGKTAEFVCVAAVWALTGYTIFKLTNVIRAWQDTSPWGKREIHFTEFKKSHVAALSEYLALIQKHREFLSFKVIAVERSTAKRPIEEVVQRLHEFMLTRGAEHEIKNSRIKLPHEIELTVDAEQSLDAIACADIKSRIAAAYKMAYGGDLIISSVSSISSHKSELVQLADVVAGAVNRRKNHKGEPGHKDEMADMVITQLDIQLKQDDIPGVDASTWLYV
jgi:Protein of unknown function (DUF3800)